MKKQFLFLLLAVILLSSCATATLSEFPGVGRVKQYDFYSYDIPPAFDGFRIGFASDFHYESCFKRSELTYFWFTPLVRLSSTRPPKPSTFPLMLNHGNITRPQKRSRKLPSSFS